ncbi:MAG TPA: secondary thiamine-phosphate synthase enzyme YjbQ [Terriglobia bacterium]|nr:secondary thiamine-phosphate synthase enzyme YjbQ [Terriglobia bacterium]
MPTIIADTIMAEAELTGLRVRHGTIRLESRECLEFIDLTERVREMVRESGVRCGSVNVQTRHTTTAILVSESEPLLMEDLKRQLERLVPCGAAYRHDDFGVRTVNMCPDEKKNGHSHCKALFLHASETLNIVDGNLDLGQWQRIFLIELDRARPRTVSVVVLGEEA